MPRPFAPNQPPRIVGRYALFHELASGGMATVHLGRLLGSVGFNRTVAVKRLHAQHAKDPDFVAMLLDEARLAARISHPNVVSTLDVVVEEDEVFLVMDYVHGESIARLLRVATSAGRTVPVPIAVSIIIGMLHGLHAAHEARNELGDPLDIVHRDVSPQNVLVGADGVARVLDFGVAKAANRIQTTQDGQLKGKLRYMSPEQLRSEPVTRSSDIFSAAIVAWELLTCQRFAASDEPGAIIAQILSDATTRPSTKRKELDWVADEVLLRALKRDPSLRYPTALDFAVALEKMGTASLAEVSRWVKDVAATELAARAVMLRETESRTSVPPPSRASLPSMPLESSREVDPETSIDARAGRYDAHEPEVDEDDIQTRVVAGASRVASQQSSISVSASVPSPQATPPRRSRAPLVVASVALAIVVGVTALLIVRARTAIPRSGPAAAPVLASGPASGSGSGSGSGSASVSASASASVSASGSASGLGSASASASAAASLGDSALAPDASPVVARPHAAPSNRGTHKPPVPHVPPAASSDDPAAIRLQR